MIYLCLRNCIWSAGLLVVMFLIVFVFLLNTLADVCLVCIVLRWFGSLNLALVLLILLGW